MIRIDSIWLATEPMDMRSRIQSDETPGQMLAPGSMKTHLSYVWAYAIRSAYNYNVSCASIQLSFTTIFPVFNPIGR